jgi:hypothetical protein
MTVVLGKYGDGFCKAFFEELRKYREGLKYGEFIERNFSGGESVLRLIDEKHPGKNNFFTNPDKLREMVKKDGEVLVVYRGKSGVSWKPANIVTNLIGLGAYLKKPFYGLRVEKLFLFEPNEPFEKQDKSEYMTKKTGDVICGEPCSVDEIREIMKLYFNRIVTTCAHDARGEDGWIVKKCRQGKRSQPISKWEGLPADEQAGLETLADWTNFLYNIDTSDIVEAYIQNVVDRFPGTYVITPDGTPMLKKNRLVDGQRCRDGGHMEKERELAGEGQGELKYNSVFDLDLRHASVLIPDDLIMSGKTMGNTVDRVIEKGAEHVRCVGFHGQFHDIPELGKDSLAILQEKRTKSEYGLNKVRVHASNTVDNPAFHPPLDILSRGVEVCHRVLK